MLSSFSVPKPQSKLLPSLCLQNDIINDLLYVRILKFSLYFNSIMPFSNLPCFKVYSHFLLLLPGILEFVPKCHPLREIFLGPQSLHHVLCCLLFTYTMEIKDNVDILFFLYNCGHLFFNVCQILSRT